MYQPKFVKTAAHTDRLLSRLNFAIDEANLVKTIVATSDRIRLLETTETYQERIQSLTDEIILLEGKLEAVRLMAASS